MLFDRVRNFAGRALGGIGSAMKTIGNVGTKAIRTLGSVSAPVSAAVSSVGSLFGPEGAAVAAGINRGIQAVTSGKAQSAAAGIAGAGSALQNLGRSMVKV